MVGPRDNPAGIPYAANPLTGAPISDQQIAWIKKLTEASYLMRAVMHEIDGSTFAAEMGQLTIDDRYSTRNLAVAATKLDEAIMWTAKQVFES